MSTTRQTTHRSPHERPTLRARTASSDTIHALHQSGSLALDHFDHRRSSTAELPDPRPLLDNLTRCVIEILGGARDIDQISRWVDDGVYRHLLKRVVLASRARSVRGQSAKRVPFTIGRITIDSPRDGVIEGVVMVHNRVRSRAVAIRLEGLDGRWRASAIHVL